MIEDYTFIEGESITARFGVAQTRDNEDIDNLIKRVDDAMYLAKYSGKNRVTNIEKAS